MDYPRIATPIRGYPPADSKKATVHFPTENIKKNLQFRTSDFDFRTISGPFFRTQIQTKFNPTRHSSRKETQFRTIFRTLFRTVSQTGLAEFPDAFPDAFPDFPSLTLGSSSATHVAAVFHMLLFPINAFLDAILVHFLGHFSGPFSRLFLSHSRFITCHICCCSLSYVAIPSYVIYP